MADQKKWRKVMFKTIEIKMGNESSWEFLKIPCEGITVFVGPNNSGKSLILRELDSIINNGENNPRKLLNGYELSWKDLENVEKNLELVSSPPPQGEVIPLGHKNIGSIT